MVEATKSCLVSAGSAAPVAPPTHRAAGTELADCIFYPALLALAALLAWLCRVHPAALPFWLPWEFSCSEFLAAGLALWWYWRGWQRTAANERPPAARRLAYAAGVIAMYAVLQTRFDYLAQHMFCLDRVRHMVLHHVGPVLIVLGRPGALLARGAPIAVRRFASSRAVARALAAVQQPLVAAVLFVGLVAFWLIPAVQFRAMLDVRVYAVMNWSMLLDGVLFWWLVLGPSRPPPARDGFPIRFALALGVLPPQVAIGALISLSARQLYPSFELCGRVFPAIGAMADQALGGLVIWVPGAMMSGLAVSLLLSALLRNE